MISFTVLIKTLLKKKSALESDRRFGLSSDCLTAKNHTRIGWSMRVNPETQSQRK